MLFKQITLKYYCYFSSPIGKLLLSADDNYLYSISMPASPSEGKVREQLALCNSKYHNKIFTKTINQLADYFKGRLTRFSLPIKITGTEFQIKVLSCVKKIPFGKTCSYSSIAKKIDNLKAVRAVGGANASNPLPIVIPCHRVIGKNGDLTGFLGGKKHNSIDIKRYLLSLETERSSRI